VGCGRAAGSQWCRQVWVQEMGSSIRCTTPSVSGGSLEENCDKSWTRVSTQERRYGARNQRDKHRRLVALGPATPLGSRLRSGAWIAEDTETDRLQSWGWNPTCSFTSILLALTSRLALHLHLPGPLLSGPWSGLPSMDTSSVWALVEEKSQFIPTPDSVLDGGPTEGPAWALVPGPLS
jgi:hypothetical protein